ncbi:MAG: hypothetical protein V2A63_03595 [Patescibacteria group bacterium]
MTKKFFAIAALTFLLVGCTTNPDSSNVSDEQPLTPEESVAPTADTPTTADSNFVRGEVVGSCGSIETHSACIDYIGSMWTPQVAELGCSSGEGMVFSKDACPVTDAIGGCRIGAGSSNEMITWFYDIGAEPVDPETVQYAAASCNATPNASWVGAN